MDFIEACRKFIEFDTSPGGGTLELAQFALQLCRAQGLHAEIQVENHNGNEHANIIARPLGGDLPNDELLLQTHLDTGSAGAYALWTKTGANPFNASIYSDPVNGRDVLYGLGAANTKLDFLCKLQAIAESGKRSGKIPFVLAGTFGEEVGMPGIIKLIRKKMISARSALVGEPTEMKIVYAGKGFAGVEIEIPFSQAEREFRVKHDLIDGTTTQSKMFSGRAAHSSIPQAGENAVQKMFDYVKKLPDGIAVMNIEGGLSANTVPANAIFEFDMVGELTGTMNSKISRIIGAIEEVEKQFRDFPDLEFEVPEATLNIGMVRTYQEFVKMSGCCRLPPSVSNEIYERWIDKLRAACAEVGAVFRVTEYKQPFRTPLSTPLLEACQSELTLLGLSSSGCAQSVTNEANVLSRFGVACVVIGPGQGVGNSHAPNEHVKIDDLHLATRFYKGVLERVCL